MKKTIILFTLFQLSCFIYAQTNSEITKKNQEAIINEYVTNCAKKYSYNYQMAEWQNCLDEGLKKDSTIAYLWQQKAMPYFKARKYEIGMQYIDKAVQYDPREWQPYRAFIKCIFAKTYREAIIDFEDCIKKYGNGYRMDHTYAFYIGLCYLQLNEYEKAEKLFKEYNDDIFKNRQGLEHPTALFYYGISKYEQKRWEEAIVEFDKALKIYPNLSDVKYYKAICLARLEKKEESSKLYKEAEQDAKMGYTINEDNTVYETYPYQVRWK
ncbi:MAG TPA: tetratricopeptide repeat protein [Flavobacterium sp.]|uniref:tetratricopeptide repeat protein n=1 Tax=Flavobacterium sp. TaxID=239 RepID=UPI002DBC8CB4|nr:tetratricopeptide repeat protein [Flavobacterium sp.]HEU4791528.1 tetratricopeptide repeat protein [Flavobacterium sp.]